MSQLRLSQQPLTLTRRLLPSAAAVALVLLMALSLLLVCPVIVSQASAEGEITRETSSDFTAYVRSSVSVSLASRIDVDIIPKANAVFKAKSADLTISTNNITGYSVYLKTADKTNALVDKTSTTNSATIPTIIADQTPTEFSPNTWGYHFSTTAPDDASTYSPVPLDSTATLATTETTASSDQYQLTFGTKVDSTLPAGEYSNAVTVSVVANPMTVTSLTQLTYMQDMTSDICSITPAYVDKDHYATKQLIDTRDGKSYWVAKLADGNCWMTQNLALTFKDFDDNQGIRAMTEDGKAGAVLTKENTDLPDTVQQYNITRETYTSLTGFTNNISAYASWNFGKYVLANPKDITSCPFMASGSIEQCSRAINVAGWSDKFSIGNGDNTVDAESQTYDAHYLIGTYYQPALANASVTNHTQSICPKGWQMPLATGSTTNKGDFTALLTPYNLTSVASNEVYDIVMPPLSVLRIGMISDSGLGNFGERGFLWSSNYVNSGQGYTRNLYIEQNKVFPSHDYYKYLGEPVRCLAR